MRIDLPGMHKAPLPGKGGVAAPSIVFLAVLLALFMSAFAAATPPADDLRLVMAAKNKDHSAVRSLLNQRVNVNAVQADGTTALAWAAHWGDHDLMELLIRAGANVNMANDYGISPLSLACTNSDAAAVKSLLQAKANPNSVQTTGETALMTCARTGNAAAVKALLAAEANPNAKEIEHSQTALMWAAAEDHAEVVRTLIEYGADIRARSKAGFTPMMFAAQQNSLEAARTLLSAGADVNEGTPENGSPLTMSSANGHSAFSIFLLEKGANANAADAYGMTPLHYAVKKGISDYSGVEYRAYRQPPPNMPDLLKALLAHGANPNAKITRDYPQYSRSPARPIAKVAGGTAFFLAAVGADIESMRILAAAGADPRLAADDGTTPLMAASGVGRIQLRTPEEQKSSLAAARLLVELGIDDINAVNARGQTALHGAAFLGSEALVQLLVDSGASLNVKDRSGKTPLNIADDKPTVVEYGSGNHEGTATLLRKLGAQ